MKNDKKKKSKNAEIQELVKDILEDVIPKIKEQTEFENCNKEDLVWDVLDENGDVIESRINTLVSDILKYAYGHEAMKQPTPQIKAERVLLLSVAYYFAEGCKYRILANDTSIIESLKVLITAGILDSYADYSVLQKMMQNRNSYIKNINFNLETCELFKSKANELFNLFSKIELHEANAIVSNCAINLQLFLEDNPKYVVPVAKREFDQIKTEKIAQKIEKILKDKRIYEEEELSRERNSIEYKQFWAEERQKKRQRKRNPIEFEIMFEEDHIASEESSDTLKPKEIIEIKDIDLPLLELENAKEITFY